LLRDFNAKIGREGIFKSTIGSVYTKLVMIMELRVVNFATSKNLIVKSAMFPHRNIHKFIWISPDGKTHNQIDHILLDRRRHSSILDVRSFRAADCDTEHYLVVVKFRERLAVNKQTKHRFHMERFNLKKLKEVEGKEQYHFDTEVDINGVWETVRETTESRYRRLYLCVIITVILKVL
jgi:hypothetical protein